MIERIVTQKDIENIRSKVITGKYLYGMDECLLCGKQWLRRPNTENTDHTNCIASPIEVKEENH